MVPFHLIERMIPIGYHNLQPLLNLMAPFATFDITLRKNIKVTSYHMQQIIFHMQTNDFVNNNTIHSEWSNLFGDSTPTFDA